MSSGRGVMNLHIVLSLCTHRTAFCLKYITFACVRYCQGICRFSLILWWWQWRTAQHVGMKKKIVVTWVCRCGLRQWGWIGWLWCGIRSHCSRS